LRRDEPKNNGRTTSTTELHNEADDEKSGEEESDKTHSNLSDNEDCEESENMRDDDCVVVISADGKKITINGDKISPTRQRQIIDIIANAQKTADEAENFAEIVKNSEKKPNDDDDRF